MHAVWRKIKVALEGDGLGRLCKDDAVGEDSDHGGEEEEEEGRASD